MNYKEGQNNMKEYNLTIIFCQIGIILYVEKYFNN